jgi:hypothetical protein
LLPQTAISLPHTAISPHDEVAHDDQTADEYQPLQLGESDEDDVHPERRELFGCS